MQAAAYVRVSSKTQNVASQRAAILRCALARGDRITRWFTEHRSAKSIDRVELQRLRAAIRYGEVRCLYVYRLDRLTRTGIADTFNLLHEIRDVYGCKVVNVADGFDINGPTAEVIIAVMAWAAKMERLAINERIADARLRLEAEGRPWGRPSRLTAEQRAQVQKLRSAGKTIREIAMTLRVPRATIGRAAAAKPSQKVPTPLPPVPARLLAPRKAHPTPSRK